MSRLPRRSAATSVLSVLTLGASLLVAAVAAPAPASASTAMHACTHDEISNGKKMTEVQLLHHPFVMTHATRRRIPANTEFKHAVAMRKQTVVEASIKATASVEAEAGAFFAKAKVKAGVEIAGRGSKTSETTVTDTFTVPRSSRERVYVFYDGVDTFAMRAHLRTCSRAGQKDAYGSLSTFNPIDESGAVLCPHSRYRSGTISYQVTLKAGC